MKKPVFNAKSRRQWGVALATALLSAASLTAVAEATAQAAPADRLQVLFLGDDRLHQPFRRAKEILPTLAHNGIDMVYTDNPAELNPERLNQFHSLIFYNNQPTITQDQLSALLRFVDNGGGLVVLHAGSASFQNSEEFIRLVGGAFMSHGTGTFTADRVNATHAAIQGVPTIESWDETYVHTKHNPVNRTVLEVRREGGHEEPWTWVKTYGGGRVFYTAWGHDARTWSNEAFQRLVVQGTRWSAGDWGLAAGTNEPSIPKQRLEVPLPTYVQGAPWNTLGPPIWEAQVPLPMEESYKLTTLEPGFSFETFATEPMIGRIIDFTWDERGRMWAAETNDYPNRLLPDGEPGGDRILILEDTDADGQADDVTVFADGLNLVTSLVLIDGGLVVAQAPHFFFMKDTDGDDVADVKETIMTGWPRNDTHGTPSNFRYGFDNQILASVGYNGFRGTVGGHEYGPGEFSQGYFRFTPDGENLDYLARTSNNTWGVALTEDGYIFGSTANGRPSSFVHIPARYYQTLDIREPILPDIATRPDIYPVTSIMQVDQFGLYTSGAAHEIYTARAFPEEYWNRKAFITDPTGNLVGMFDLQRQGSAFSAKNDWSFFASRDPWVAPVQVKVGPDGALWVSDFYSLVAQHNPFVEMDGCCPRGEGNAYETPNRDAEHARLYRVVYDGAPQQTPMRLDNATPGALVAALSDNNMFWRLTAQRLLVERGERDVVPALIELVNDHTIDELGLNPGALHALWTLHGLGALGNDPAARAAVTNALYHPAMSLRRAALMALPRDAQLESAIFTAGLLPDKSVTGAANVGSATLQDADPTVRLEALLVLSELPRSEKAAAAVREMVSVAGNIRDRWLPDAIAIAAAQHSPDLALELLRARPAATDSAYLAGARSIVQLLTRYHASQGDLASIMALVQAVPEANPFVGQGVLVAIAGQQGGGPGQGGGGGGGGGGQPPNPITRPFRTVEWRNNDIAGWPEDQPPTLSPEQRTAFVAAARASDPELNASFVRVATRWGMPELLQ